MYRVSGGARKTRHSRRLLTNIEAKDVGLVHPCLGHQADPTKKNMWKGTLLSDCSVQDGKPQTIQNVNKYYGELG